MIFKSIAGALSPLGHRSRLTIFIFHRVHSQVDPLFPGEPDARRFNEILSWVVKWFHVMPLDEAVLKLGNGGLPSRAAAITFDDGYADNAMNALPILKYYAIPATFFIASSFLDGGRMWNDSVIEAVRGYRGNILDLRDAGLGTYSLDSNSKKCLAINSLLGKIKYFDPSKRVDIIDWIVDIIGCELTDELMLRSEQVLELRSARMQIGAHTCSHPILEKISDSQAKYEIIHGRLELEFLLDEAVSLFAYPNGKPGVDYSYKHVEMVQQAGYLAAVSTAPGVALKSNDLYQLPRFTPWDRTRSRFGLRLLVNLFSTSPDMASSTLTCK